MTRACMLVAALILAAVPARSATNLAPAYQGIRAGLQRSAVPVLLPTKLPPAFGDVRSVALIFADRDGYYVAFSPVANCAGALSCAFFHMSGYPRTSRTNRSQRHGRAVVMSDGTRGLYVRADCSGFSCTEASLIFERGGAVYELDAKTARDELTALESAYETLRVLR